MNKQEQKQHLIDLKTIEEVAEEYAEKCFNWPLNKYGEKYKTPVGQITPYGFTKHKKTATKHFLAGANHQKQIDENLAFEFACFLRTQCYISRDFLSYSYKSKKYSEEELFQIFQSERSKKA